MTTPDRLSGRKTLKVSGILDEFEKDRIKDDIDIVSLFESFGVSLTKKGKNYMGRCPWHEDSSPSLSVDKDKGLYNCFGCGESGDAFSLVEKIKGVDFKGALEYLKNSKTNIIPIISKPIETAQENKTSKTPDIQEEIPPVQETSSITFEDIVHHWIERLHHNEPAQKYLEGRGLSNKQNHGFFSVGYSDGSLVDKLSEAQKKRLVEIGILNDKGREVFEGFVIVPLIAADNRIKGIYGRSISDASTALRHFDKLSAEHAQGGSSATKKSIKHLYLKGPLHGLINRRSFPIYRDRMILTESVIDALSLYELDIKNVCACYGTNGFKDEHLKALKDSMVKEVVIAFDADEAGRKASSELKERLITEGFSVKVIEPAVGKDWNESLTTGMTRDDFEALMQNGAVFVKEKLTTEQMKVEKKGESQGFSIDDRTYWVTGAKQGFASSLKVNIKAIREERRDYDSVELYSSRSRKTFADRISQSLEVDSIRIEKDLVEILEWLEAERDRKFLSPELKVQELTEEEKIIGMKFLKNPAMYREVEKDVNELGYVSEEGQNILIVYIAELSRFFPEPLSVFVRGGPSGGKTALVKTVTKLIPEDDKWSAHDMSEQSLHYVEEEKLNGKVVLMGEDLHDEKIEGKVRQMQSDNELTKLVTVKDEQTGVMRAENIIKNVRLCFIITSTKLAVNPENMSRCLVLSVDETPLQTEKVHCKTGQKHLCVGMNTEIEKDMTERIIKKHRVAQRLLKPVVIFNPFGMMTKFPTASPEMRRAFDYFLYFIDAICFGRQMQKKYYRMTVPGTGKREIVKKCDIQDYELGYSLFVEGILRKNLIVDITSSTRELYEAIRDMSRKHSKEKQLSINEISFSQKTIREETGYKHEFVKKHVRILVGYEYLMHVSSTRSGQTNKYRLVEDLAMEELDISMITKPQEMKNLLREFEEKKLKDQEELDYEL